MKVLVEAEKDDGNSNSRKKRFISGDVYSKRENAIRWRTEKLKLIHPTD